MCVSLGVSLSRLACRLLVDGAKASDDERDDGVGEADERKKESAITEVNHGCVVLRIEWIDFVQNEGNGD